MSWPSRVWRKKTGPGESRLIRQAAKAKSGAVETSSGRGADDVDARLSSREEREALDRRQADERQALDACACFDVRADDLEQPRHDVDLDVERRAAIGSSSSVSSCELAARTRRRRARRRALRTSCGSSLRRPRTRHAGRGRCAQLPRLGVDEADEVDPVLGVLEQLARDELADVAGADDDGVLEVRGLRRQQRCGRRREPSVTNAIASAQKVDELGEVRARRRRRATTPTTNEPGADRDEVEDADEVVERRVVGPLLVVVVEPVELRDTSQSGSVATKSEVLVAQCRGVSAAPLEPKRSSVSEERAARARRRRRRAARAARASRARARSDAATAGAAARAWTLVSAPLVEFPSGRWWSSLLLELKGRARVRQPEPKTIRAVGVLAFGWPPARLRARRSPRTSRPPR